MKKTQVLGRKKDCLKGQREFEVAGGGEGYR